MRTNATSHGCRDSGGGVHGLIGTVLVVETGRVVLAVIGEFVARGRSQIHDESVRRTTAARIIDAIVRHDVQTQANRRSLPLTREVQFRAKQMVADRTDRRRERAGEEIDEHADDTHGNGVQDDVKEAVKEDFHQRPLERRLNEPENQDERARVQQTGENERCVTVDEQVLKVCETGEQDELLMPIGGLLTADDERLFEQLLVVGSGHLWNAMSDDRRGVVAHDDQIDHGWNEREKAADEIILLSVRAAMDAVRVTLPAGGSVERVGRGSHPTFASIDGRVRVSRKVVVRHTNENQVIGIALVLLKRRVRLTRVLGVSLQIGVEMCAVVVARVVLQLVGIDRIFADVDLVARLVRGDPMALLHLEVRHPIVHVDDKQEANERQRTRMDPTGVRQIVILGEVA